VIRSSTRCLQALLVVGSLCSSRPSFARPGPSDTASPSAPDAAGELFDKGNAFYHQSRWAEAEVQFQKAWNLKQSFDVAANLGDCELQVGQNREATEHLAFAVRAFPVSGKPAVLDRLRQRFAEARALTGALRIQLAVKGAEITVDGRAVGVAPLADEVFVDPGARVVEARLEGYDVGRASVTATKGATQGVTLTLARKGADPIVAPTTGPRLPIILGGAALGLVALGAGIGFTVAANGKSTDADALVAKLPSSSSCTGTPVTAFAADCKTLKSTLSAQSTMRNAAVLSFAASGVFAVVTAGLGVWKLKSPANAGVLQVAPVVGAREGGVILGGTW
jgi:hypothetical protein